MNFDNKYRRPPAELARENFSAAEHASDSATETKSSSATESQSKVRRLKRIEKFGDFVQQNPANLFIPAEFAADQILRDQEGKHLRLLLRVSRAD